MFCWTHVFDASKQVGFLLLLLDVSHKGVLGRHTERELTKRLRWEAGLHNCQTSVEVLDLVFEGNFETGFPFCKTSIRRD